MSAQTGGARVVRVADEHLDALVAFYRQVWDPDADVETVRAARARESEANPVEPGADVPTFLFMLDDEAVGHLGTIPVRLWCGGEERSAHWLQGLWVLPEHRNGPIGFLLVREALARIEIAMSVVVEVPPRRLFSAQGFHDYGPIPNFVRLLRPARVLDRLDVERTGLVSIPSWAGAASRAAQKMGAGRVAGAALAGATRLWISGGEKASVHVSRDTRLDPGAVEALWRRMRGGLRAAPSRDGAALEHRYPLDEGSPYRAVSIHSGGSLSGLAVIRAPGPSSDPRLAGINLAVVAELLYPLGEPELGIALLAAAEELARDLDADALLCTTSHRSLPPLLHRRAFVRLPGNQHFMIRDASGRDDYPDSLDGWWLTRGDSRADTSF